jgi:hypothetical protein
MLVFCSYKIYNRYRLIPWCLRYSCSISVLALFQFSLCQRPYWDLVSSYLGFIEYVYRLQGFLQFLYPSRSLLHLFPPLAPNKYHPCILIAHKLCIFSNGHKFSVSSNSFNTFCIFWKLFCTMKTSC